MSLQSLTSMRLSESMIESEKVCVNHSFTSVLLANALSLCAHWHHSAAWQCCIHCLAVLSINLSKGTAPELLYSA